jgi:Mor family transcriptional regulator
MSIEIEARYLPPILQEIAELIGLQATLVLVKSYGGTRLYVPKRFDSDHPIVKLIGHEQAARFFEKFGGQDQFDFPKGEIAVKAARDKQIRGQRADGATHARLAVTHGLSERQIRNILGPEVDDKQIGLF